MRPLYALVLGLLLPAISLAQADGKIGVPKAEAPAVVKSLNEVEGLKLPPNVEVEPDEGFVLVAAECKGQVKFLILSNQPKPVKAVPGDNQIVVAIPPTPGTVVSVFAVGFDNGKLTDFARTDITVKGNPTRKRTTVDGALEINPGSTGVPPTGARLHLTMIVNGNVATAPNLTAVVQSYNAVWKTLVTSDPAVDQRNLRRAIQDIPLPALLIQTDDGRFWGGPPGKAVPYPGSEQAVVDLLKKLRGNQP